MGERHWLTNMSGILFSGVVAIFGAAKQLVLIATLSLLTTDADADIKCWTNKDGVRECGDAVPPEYAQQGHEVKSRTGMTIKKQDPAKTPEEVGRERREKEIAARKQTEIEAIARKQANADKVLLDTFGSEDDMVLARDGQLTNIDSQIKLTEGHVAKLQKSFEQLISKAADFERRNQQIPENLRKDIANLREQIAEQRRFIEDKLEEQVSLRRKFDLDLARFRELRSALR